MSEPASHGYKDETMRLHHHYSVRNSIPLQFSLVESDEYCAVAAFIGLRIALHMSGLEDTDDRLQFFELTVECENVAGSILQTPEGRSFGTLETLLNFPCSLDGIAFEMRYQVAQFVLDRLKKWLQNLESRIPDGGGPSAAAPIMQTANQLSPAATTGGSPAPAPIMQTANQPSIAATTGGSSAPTPNLQTANSLRKWSCPPLPQELKTVRARTKDGVHRTDPAYYWDC